MKAKVIAEEYAERIWNEKNLDAIEKLVDKDVTIHSLLGDFRGKEALKQVVEAWLNAFPDLQVINKHSIEEGDWVSIEWHAKGTHRGFFKGIQPTGKWVSYSGVTIYRISDGKIVEYAAYLDMRHLLNQLIHSSIGKQIETKHLILRNPYITDIALLRQFDKRNIEHLAKWETKVSIETDHEYRQRLDLWIKECEEGRAARFFIFLKNKPEQLIGICNFTQIVHGPFKACYLGYKIDGEQQGKGLMFEALKGAIEYVFKELHLHRIMANYMPNNARSANLLKRLGFVIEGHAKNYLMINNRFEDHVLTSLTQI